MERLDSKFYEKYTALKVPPFRFFLIPFLWPARDGLTLQLLFSGLIPRRAAEAEAARRGARAKAGGGVKGALRW